MKNVFLISLLLGLWLISVDSYAQPGELISAVRGTQLAEHAGRPDNGRNQSGPDSNVYYAVATEFTAAKLGVEYRLISLEMDRRYHVLIEVDGAMRVTEGPFDDPGYPEEGRKRRQYKEFIDSLGPDPRKTKY